MKIQLQNIGKRFNREWIFKNIDLLIETKSKVGIIGSNGSGKSTLIKLISAAEIPSKGEIKYSVNNSVLEADNVYAHINFAAPYIDLPEELKLIELVNLHCKFKQLKKGLTTESFLERIYLQEYKNKQVKNFSSGMKQRLKLGLALCFDSDLILLDEPCSNLDSKGITLYKDLSEKYTPQSTLIIGSNEQVDELHNITNMVNVLDFKSEKT